MSGEGFSPRVEELGELEGEGIVPVTKIDDDGGSGGAPVWSGRGSYRRRGRNPAVAQAR
jgi:hypothetical protein